MAELLQKQVHGAGDASFQWSYKGIDVVEDPNTHELSLKFSEDSQIFVKQQIKGEEEKTVSCSVEPKPVKTEHYMINILKSEN